MKYTRMGGACKIANSALPLATPSLNRMSIWVDISNIRFYSGSLHESLNSKRFNRKRRFSAIDEFADGLTGTGTVTHSVSTVTGSNNQMRTVGYRADNGTLIGTERTKSGEKTHGFQSAEKRYCPTEFT